MLISDYDRHWKKKFVSLLFFWILTGEYTRLEELFAAAGERGISSVDEERPRKLSLGVENRVSQRTCDFK